GVECGAKGTVIKPRCRRGGVADLLRRAMNWCLQQVPRPGRRHDEEAAREEAPGPRLASYSSALAAQRRNSFLPDNRARPCAVRKPPTAVVFQNAALARSPTERVLGLPSGSPHPPRPALSPAIPH